jgi:hypothetical protein
VNIQGFKTYNMFFYKGLRIKTQLDRFRIEMEPYLSTRKYRKSDNYYPQVVRKDSNRKEEVG